jgi:hypothetical protein
MNSKWKKHTNVAFKIDKEDGVQYADIWKRFPKDRTKSENLIESLLNDEGRFIFLDFDNNNDDENKTYKIISILSFSIIVKTEKVMYSITYGSLNSSLYDGIDTKVQYVGTSKLFRELIFKREKKRSR